MAKIIPFLCNTKHPDVNALDAAGRISSYAKDWNEGRRVWRDEDVAWIIQMEMVNRKLIGRFACGLALFIAGMLSSAIIMVIAK